MAVDGYNLQPELMSVLVGVNDTCLDGQRPNGVPLGTYGLPCLPCLMLLRPCCLLSIVVGSLADDEGPCARAAAKYERVYRDFLQEMREECPGIRYAYRFYRPPLPFQLQKGQAIMASKAC